MLPCGLLRLPSLSLSLSLCVCVCVCFVCVCACVRACVRASLSLSLYVWFTSCICIHTACTSPPPLSFSLSRALYASVYICIYMLGKRIFQHRKFGLPALRIRTHFDGVQRLGLQLCGRRPWRRRKGEFALSAKKNLLLRSNCR